MSLYYTAPSDEIFNEIKTKSIELWKGYDNSYGCVDEKLERINNIKNIKDNALYIIAMFDFFNQKKLSNMLSNDARTAVYERIKSSGTPEEYNPFKQ